MPDELTRAEENRYVQNPQAPRKEHDGRNSLDGKFEVGANRANIVVDSQEKNKAARHQNCHERPHRKSSHHWEMSASEQTYGDADQEREKYRDTTISRERGLMQVAFL